MLPKNWTKSISIGLFCVIFLFLTLLALTFNPVLASEGSIARVNNYPENGETLQAVNYFLLQTTGANTNTTVSVSIDGGTPIPMTYQGSINEIVPGDTIACEWYTWQIFVSAITTPGEHTFQFFSHYYVWQNVDQYWAAFESSSDVHTFNITSNNQMFSPSPTPNSTPSAIVIPLNSPTQLTPTAKSIFTSSATSNAVTPEVHEYIPIIIALGAFAVASTGILLCIKKSKRQTRIEFDFNRRRSFEKQKQIIPKS